MLRLKVEILFSCSPVHRGSSLADSLEEILYLAFGMSLGAFLFVLGSYTAFRWHRKLLEPLMKLLTEFFEVVRKATGEKK